MEFIPYKMKIPCNGTIKFIFKRSWYKRLFWKPWVSTKECVLGPEYFKKKLAELQKDMEKYFTQDLFKEK